jgi:hypothetical protein
MPNDPEKFHDDHLAWTPPLWDAFPGEARPRREAERVRAARARDLREILSTQAGKRFFRDMMILCGVFSEQFKGNSSTYYDQGCRAVGLRYWNLIGEVDKDLQKDISPPYGDWPYAEKEEE